MDGDGFEVDGPRIEWERTGDPRWVWRAVRHCIHHREPLPDWALNYLGRCAEAIENIKGDYGRGLHRALEFSPKSGRKRKNEIDLTTEQFAIAFTKAILKGDSADKARAEASGQVDGPKGKDDKDLTKRLREFFDLRALPKRSEQWRWKLIVSTWLLNHPHYVERYPDLPRKFDFR